MEEVHVDYLVRYQTTNIQKPPPPHPTRLPSHPSKALTAGKVRGKQETAVEERHVPVVFLNSPRKPAPLWMSSLSFILDVPFSLSRGTHL